MEFPQELRIVWRYRWWLGLLALLAAVAAYAVSSSRTDLYRGDAVVRILPGGQVSGSLPADPSSLQELTKSYSDVARSRQVYELARRTARPRATAGALRSASSVKVGRGGTLTLGTESPQPRTAAAWANSVANAFIRRVDQVEAADRSAILHRIESRVAEIRKKLDQPHGGSGERTSLTSELEGLQSRSADIRIRPADTARLIEAAGVPASPASPKPLRDALIALAAVLLLGAGLVYLWFGISNRYETAEDLGSDVDLPLLGELPRAEADDPRSVEAFRALRTNTEFAIKSNGRDFGAPTGASGNSRGADARPRSATEAAARWLERRRARRGSPAGREFDAGANAANGRQGAVILVTSAEAGAGKTFVTANLAHAFALDGRRAIAVDADLRRPAVHERYGIPLEGGMTDILGVTAAHPEQVPPKQVPLPEAAASRGGELYAMTAGWPSDDSAEMLSTRVMEDFMTNVRRQFDVVVLDSPPVLGVTDPAILSRYVDGVVVVVDARRSQRRRVRRALEALGAVQANLVGSVFNGASKDQATYYGYGYGYDARAKKPEPTSVG